MSVSDNIPTCLRCHSPATSTDSAASEDINSLDGKGHGSDCLPASPIFNLKSDKGQIAYICHASCHMTCKECNQTVEEGRCFVDNEANVYCRPCYRSHFKICTICDEIIKITDFAMVFDEETNIHRECMTCSVCCKPYSKGHNINLESKQIFCQEHSVLVTSTEVVSEQESTTLDTVEQTMKVENDEENEKDDDKKKRTPRTKFNEKQTALMMNIFAQTPRPTRLMREQMAKETGLPIRCIQIWFQNKRSKEKRQSSKRSFMHHQANWYHPYQQTAMPIYRAPPSVSPPQPQGLEVVQGLVSTHLPAAPVYRYPSPPSSDCGSDYYQPQQPSAAFDVAFEGLSAVSEAQPCYPSPPWGMEN